MKMYILTEDHENMKTIRVSDGPNKPEYLLINLSKKTRDIQLSFDRKDLWAEHQVSQEIHITDFFEGGLKYVSESDEGTRKRLEGLIQDEKDITLFIIDFYKSSLKNEKQI